MKEGCSDEDESGRFLLSVFPQSRAGLPEEFRELGHEALNFDFAAIRRAFRWRVRGAAGVAVVSNRVHRNEAVDPERRQAVDGGDSRRGLMRNECRCGIRYGEFRRRARSRLNLGRCTIA